ncbi:tRNA lysidine(34) synthetase TilS [Colwellia sp. KU-HH00111]
MPLVIAYSGGVDSQVLLHAIATLKQQSPTPITILDNVTVCHVNHGLSVNAQAWQLFAQQTCDKFGLTLKVCQVNVQAQAQQSLEALARDARYQALHSIYAQPSLIITGHHSDDQAETLLLALKRGSGLKGLSAMAAETKKAKDLLVRPLLEITRTEIIDYAKTHALTWIEDESNTDTRFDRNFIRNEIMPLLNKRWPSITRTINRSSEHCLEGQLLLDELANEDLSRCQQAVDCLSVTALAELSQARFNNLIRYFLEQNHCIMPSSEQLSQLHLQLAAADDKNPAVKVGQYYLRRFKGRLFLTADFEDVSEWQTDLLLAKTSSKVVLPNKLGKVNCVITTANEVDENSQYLKLPKPGQKITISFTHTNPKCLPDYRQHSRSLKKVLQELAIPPWQRKRIPFLYYDDTLVAAVGLFVCQAYMANSKKHPLSQKIETTEPSVKITWAQ